MSETHNHSEPDRPFDERIAALIRWKARSLVGRTGLTGSDRPDLEQELTLGLLTAFPKFHAARGSRLAYARAVIHRFASNLLRERRAAKRAGGPRVAWPIEGPVAPAEPDRDLARDVAAAISTLPDHLRSVAQTLMTESVTDAAQTLGITRSTVYVRLRELRERPEFQRFHTLVAISSDTSPPNRE